MSADPASADPPMRIPDPEEPVPAVAWPTLALLVVAVGLWVASTVAYLEGASPWWLTIPVNAIASYLAFTVSHDAAHHAASSGSRLNPLMGRIATPLFAPHAAFPTWRYIHMQHHRFTNDSGGDDPDHFTMAGPAWQRPLRWLTVDLYYLVFYIPRIGTRPRGERVESLVTLGAFVTLIAVAIVTGHFVDLLVVLLIPCRLAILYLAWAFDYLPHNGLHETPSGDKLKTTRNRVGWERLATPMLLYQNYHLVHHLHPLIPFYRYIAVWRRNEDGYLAGDPELSTVRGRRLTTDEYRRMRALGEHHG